MNTVYLMAHFDDEYAAVPLLLRDLGQGEPPWLLYVADYATPALTATRLAETRRLIAHLGLDPARVLHVGAGLGVMDGSVIDGLPAAYAALHAALDAIGPIGGVVAAAWEGGHPDHDACAFLAVRLAARRGVEVEQFAFYNAFNLPPPLFSTGAPLPQNGPSRRVRLSLGQWLGYLAAVRFFPSQARTWLGLWPTMFATFLRRGGFSSQRLAAHRVLERPHPGPLLYERMFNTAYETVRMRLDAFEEPRVPS